MLVEPRWETATAAAGGSAARCWWAAGIRLAKKVIEASITSLIKSGLLFYSEYRGPRVTPDLYRQWLPRPNTSRLLVATPDRVQPSACPTLAAVTRQTQLLLSAVTAERPLATMQSSRRPAA